MSIATTTSETPPETGWDLLHRLRAEFQAKGEKEEYCGHMAAGAMTVKYDDVRCERDRLRSQLAKDQAELNRLRAFFEHVMDHGRVCDKDDCCICYPEATR